MAVRPTKRISEAISGITAAIEHIFSCGSFHLREFILPVERGAQLSMTGDIVAYGNSGSFREDGYGLCDALRESPALAKVSDAELSRYVERKRFLLLLGECDRSAAILAAAAEMVRRGISKIVIVTDTTEEKNELTRTLLSTRTGLSGIGVTEYRVDRYDVDRYKISASVYGFLTSYSPEILVIGRDSFSRVNNILNRSLGDDSPSMLISRATPVVITSSETVDAGRTLAKNAAIFHPIATFIFAGEVKRLRDAVIYRPANLAVPETAVRHDEAEQLRF